MKLTNEVEHLKTKDGEAAKLLAEAQQQKLKVKRVYIYIYIYR